MDGKSLTPQEIKLQQLKEVFAEGKVDWEGASGYMVEIS